ncbi:unnamed protein product [Ilex paraguariensis]|uniref:Pentatricopeptide repeat-containing protein n=1 Tax=Ilex paraguariensis TaxID=185542 RepID=A0ABC8SLN8_9AQUA
MLVRNIVTWNTLISGLADCGRSFKWNLELGFRCIRRMLLEMVRPDHITFTSLLRIGVELNDMEIGRGLHCFIVKLGFFENCLVNAALVDWYAKFGLVEDARRVFDYVLERDLVLWNVMMSCYVLNYIGEETFGVFSLMRMEGFKGDDFTFTNLLSCCASFGSCELGSQIHGIVVRLGIDLDVVVTSSLVDMYAKNENIADARKAFDGMVSRNVISWTTIVVGYGRYGDGKEATKLLRGMLDEDFCPDELTLASVLSSCGNLSLAGETVQVHAYTIKKGFSAFLSVANALVNSYAKCGSIGCSFEAFSSIVNPDLFSWTSMIGAYAFHGLSRESIGLFEKMLSDGVRADKIAFLGVLSACSHGGLVSEGLHYFTLMITDNQIVPDTEHYTCLVDLLGRVGLLNEAFNVLISIPVEPGSDSLGAFLGACKVHGNVGLATWAAERLFELEPNKHLNYSLMSNTYASLGCWLDVARVRKMMREMCDHRFPGCSWMDIAGKVHTFVSSDKSHPQTTEVYAVLGILYRRMKVEDSKSSVDFMFDYIGVSS